MFHPDIHTLTAQPEPNKDDEEPEGPDDYPASESDEDEVEGTLEESADTSVYIYNEVTTVLHAAMTAEGL